MKVYKDPELQVAIAQLFNGRLVSDSRLVQLLLDINDLDTDQLAKDVLTAMSVWLVACLWVWLFVSTFNLIDKL
jgi:hypothetical protein